MRLLLFLAVAAAAWAQQPASTSAAPGEIPPAMRPIQDVAGLPRVLLIGDSISIGYTLPVRELLKGKANVHRIPANGATTLRTLESIEVWLGDKKWDVIHANWGLHDLRIMDHGKHQVSLADYEKNLEKLAIRLKQAARQVIYATTTPVPEGTVKPLRHTADVPRYNDVAVRVMQRHGIPIDDLYAVVLPRLSEFQRPVNVHFTDAGSDFLAAQVAREIAKYLPSGRK